MQHALILTRRELCSPKAITTIIKIWRKWSATSRVPVMAEAVNSSGAAVGSWYATNNNNRNCGYNVVTGENQRTKPQRNVKATVFRSRPRPMLMMRGRYVQVSNAHSVLCVYECANIHNMYTYMPAHLLGKSFALDGATSFKQAAH